MLIFVADTSMVFIPLPPSILFFASLRKTQDDSGGAQDDSSRAQRHSSFYVINYLSYKTCFTVRLRMTVIF
jgi:hypothetical protein